MLGIGYCVAEALVENGAHVVVSSSNPSRVEQTVSRLKKAYPSASSRVRGHACNLGDEATLDANIMDLLEKTGKVDHIVHTAGDSLAMKPLSEIDMEQVKQAGLVRFFSPLLIAKHAPKYLTGGPNSSFTMTTGAVSDRPIPQWAVINSYATGLQGMTRGLALDLKPIRVNLVSPGAVQTELWENAGFSEEAKKGMFQEMIKKVPTGHIGTPEELAECYLYLMKDTNITGTMISSNGGSLLV